MPDMRRVRAEFPYFGAPFSGNEQSSPEGGMMKQSRTLVVTGLAAMSYSLMPERSARQHGVVAKPLVDSEFWREVCW